MKENLKVFYKSYKKFLDKPTTIIMVLYIVLFYCLPLNLQIKDRFREVDKRVEQLEAQVKNIEVQKDAENN